MSKIAFWSFFTSVVIDPANGESLQAFGMKIYGAPIGKRLIEEH